jgi:hypothetical protein
MTCHCSAIARRLGLDGDLVGAASRLHDVGMDQIADRPAPLTPAERQELLQHPRTGHALLAGSGLESFELASEIALTHHERYDGAGYPQGLKDDEIPLTGRIAAVADAFDAMTTDRVYRPAGTVAHAIQTLRAERGHQFDPRVVDAFLEGIDEAVTVLERHPGESDVYPREDGCLTLRAAAEALGMSASRLRRLSDEGWIETRRTAGGHRRFPVRDVRRLAAEAGVQPAIRPLEPPAERLPQLARVLRVHGTKIAAAAGAAVYRDGAPGWFASHGATSALDQWAAALADSADAGDYAPAVTASAALMRQAQGHATSVLERHLFVERFAHVAIQVLTRDKAPRAALVATRRLFVALQQALLD